MKRIITLLLVLTVIIGFSACGNSETENTNEVVETTETTTANTDESKSEEESNSVELNIQTKEVDGKTFFVSDGLEMLYLERWVVADMTEKKEDFYFIQADKFVDTVYMDMVYTNIFPDAEVIWDMPGPFTDEKILNKFLEIFSDVELIEPLEIDGHTFSRFKTHELRDVNDENLNVAIIHFAVVGDDSFLIATGTNDELVHDYYSQDAWHMLESMELKNVSKFEKEEE